MYIYKWRQRIKISSSPYSAVQIWLFISTSAYLYTRIHLHWKFLLLDSLYLVILTVYCDTNMSKLIKFEFTHFYVSELSSDRRVSRSTGWNIVVVARATPSLSYFLKCIIIIASCMRSVAVSFHADDTPRFELVRRRSMRPTDPTGPMARCIASRCFDRIRVQLSIFNS